MTSYRTLLRPQTLAALDALAREHDTRGSTPDGEMDIVVEHLISRKARRVLQLGTYLGHSALVMADLVAERGGVLATVDPDVFRAEVAREFVQRAGLANVDFWTGRSEDEVIVKALCLATWDAIYIDTTHTYSQTKHELEIYCGRVAGEKTLVALHDASTFAQGLDTEGKGGVKQAVAEWLVEHPEWEGTVCEPPAFPEAKYGLAVLTRRAST